MKLIDEKLDKIVSVYTRLRFADWKGQIHCYTCTWYGFWKECDAGHFKSRTYQGTRWNEDNLRPQCYECNRSADGRHEIFESELREELGDEAVDEIERLSAGSYPSDEEKQKLFIHFTTLVKALNGTL